MAIDFNDEINVIEDANVKLKIVKAILERGLRKWEFVWRGVRISAPVLVENFYRRFFNHEIVIAPGDTLTVKMKITQKRLLELGIYENSKYELLQVSEYTPKVVQKQIKLP